MVITYHGGQCFKVSFGDTTLAFNPPSKKSKLDPVRFGSDVAFVSVHHPDFNGSDQVAHGDREPFVIDGAGEYEVKGVTASGIASPSVYGGKEGINTIYQVRLEDINLTMLGSLSTEKIDAAILGELDDVDILFVPIGDELLEPGAAHELAVKLEARVIIPMPRDAASLKAFLKEDGSDVKPIDKLTVKRKDVDGMEGEVVLLSK